MNKKVEKSDNIVNSLKGVFKYITTIISWTIFVLLIIIGLLLIYYFVSVRLYATKGDAFEPKFSVYTIASGSMEPTISVYDVIVNTKINSMDDVKQNDVITFISTSQMTKGMTITHRVVGVKFLDNGEKCFVTRGDYNTQEDQACVTKKDVIGVTKAVIPGLGKIQLFLSSSIGWLFIIIVPALYIIIKDVIKIFHLREEIKEKEQDKDSELKEKQKYLKKLKSKE